MAMPQIMEEAEAYSSAIDAFAKGNPIGDGIGPLIASKMAEGAQSREIEQDTIMYETGLDGRTLLLVRAKGPGGSVGKPRSEEHTSELQSHSDLVCRLLLEKKK